MPSLGADMEFGTLVGWRVRPGDVVKRGDVVAEVETEKGNVEVEIFEGGTIEEIAVHEGTKVPVGTVLARVRGDGAVPSPVVSAAVPLPPTAAVPPPPAPAAARVPTVAAAVRASPAARALASRLGVQLATVAGTGPGGAVTLADIERAQRDNASVPSVAPAPQSHRVSPLAQRMAADLGVDVATLLGSGEGGVVTKADVERAAAARRGVVAPAAPAPAPAPPPAAAPTTVADRAAAMRQAIAAAMARSWREIPHYHLATDVDLARAVRWLEAENLKRPVTERILPAALLLKAVALALREQPDFNGFWVDGGFHPGAGIHVGVAISLRGGGLVAPAIHDTDTRSLDDVMRSLRDLVQRARGGMLRGSELTDPTVTVTNLGDQGVREVFGVISAPQVALVGIGKVAERAWAEGGMLAVRPVVTLTLAADHRASDGHRGALLLTAIDRLLQSPERL